MTSPSASGKKTRTKPNGHGNRGVAGYVSVRITPETYERVIRALPGYEEQASKRAGVPVRLTTGTVLDLLVKEHLP